MFHENDIPMLIAVIFGFACGWAYYWFLFKPKTKIVKDYSQDRIIIEDFHGHELLNTSIEHIAVMQQYSGKGEFFSANVMCVHYEPNKATQKSDV